MTVAVDGVERYQLAGLDRQSFSRNTERHVPHVPHGGGSLLQGIRRRADAALDLLHQDRSCHPWHRIRKQAWYAGVPRLRPSFARQRIDALCDGRKGRRAQYHRHLDRLLAGGAGAQSAHPGNRRASRAATSQYSSVGDPTAVDAASRGTWPICPQAQYAPQSQYAPQAQYAPQVQRPDDGYIYPADGSSDGARYPAPRGSRRLYDAQSYPQPQYYDNGLWTTIRAAAAALLPAARTVPVTLDSAYHETAKQRA